MPNRLADASSPYLQQHRDNPVDWYEWGEEAFAEARTTDRPVLLSVGYSACHWCHVMAHESFEDPETAAYMNEHFVNVKVDREERPDVDRIYMDAVQAMTGRGGWPMTVFLTPEGGPFFAGTYFPKKAHGAYPSFRNVLERIASAWTSQREDLDEQASRLTDAVRSGLAAGSRPDPHDVVRRSLEDLAETYDWQHGGFGGAPKFPQAPNLELLLRAMVLKPDIAAQGRAEAMLRTALDHMAAGGIYDHLGGGFARYSVDRVWLVPHFEKMLYDNALLARVYLRAFQLTGEPRYKRIATETLDYLIRDMRHSSGGIFSAEDADSEGVEGKFYVWEWEEFAAVVGDDAPLLAAVLGVTREGNFEGTNVLHRPVDLDTVAARFGVTSGVVEQLVATASNSLLEVRNRRVRPGLDDKVIAAWNGLALRSFAEAGAILESPDYLRIAEGIADFALTHLTDGSGRVLRSWRDGVTSVPGFCDDYAALAVGLFTVYQATGEERWYAAAEHLTREMLRLFADPAGGFFATGSDAERLIARPKNLMDNPTPSDNSLAAEALLMAGALTGDAELFAAADGVFRAAGQLLERHPTAVGHLVGVLTGTTDGPREIALVGDETDHMAAIVWETFRPDCVLAAGSETPSSIPLLEGRTAKPDGGTLAYVCRNFVCELPIDDPAELRTRLRVGAD